jgi:hypothetical protein
MSFNVRMLFLMRVRLRDERDSSLCRKVFERTSSGSRSLGLVAGWSEFVDITYS